MAEELSKMKPQVYKDPRPAEYFDRFYERPARRRPDWMYEVVRLVLTPYLAVRVPGALHRLGQDPARGAR